MRQQTAAIIGGGIAAAALVAIVVASVSPSRTVCAASASVSSPVLSVVLSGDPGSVTAIEVCTAAACSFTDGPTASPTSTAGPEETGPPGTTAPAFLHRVDSRTWSTGVGKPALARVLVRGAGGSTLVEKSFTLHWKQDSETSPCGTIQSTRPLRLALSVP